MHRPGKKCIFSSGKTEGCYCHCHAFSQLRLKQKTVVGSPDTPYPLKQGVVPLWQRYPLGLGQKDTDRLCRHRCSRTHVFKSTRTKVTSWKKRTLNELRLRKCSCSPLDGWSRSVANWERQRHSTPPRDWPATGALRLAAVAEGAWPPAPESFGLPHGWSRSVANWERQRHSTPPRDWPATGALRLAAVAEGAWPPAPESFGLPRESRSLISRSPVARLSTLETPVLVHQPPVRRFPRLQPPRTT
ncbi:hypothetical protein LSTR_LSTR001996 [Laodelphax striatellus]|uniref:Uncharacterized protein n=1 Tax=Laodelphax striatellus TaxID=195883 RepID=A0A482XG94_LAOST|nr:hypothetical protein LSTR_LSTR001996 [Laodelphax striatellus]